MTTRKGKTLTGIILMAALFILGAAILGGWLWINFRPQPAPKQEILFEGVEYIRDVRSSPRPMVIHVIKVDLKADGIRILVTPGNPKDERPLAARTTSKFLDEFKLQIAINGDGFEPWHSNAPWDYYPHYGDPVDVIGLAASQGEVYSVAQKGHPTLYLSTNNKARFNQPYAKMYNAISGNMMLVRNGTCRKALSKMGRSHAQLLHSTNLGVI